MNKRTNIFLFFLLLLQIALIGYMYRPGRQAPPPQEVAFFKGVTPEQVVKVEISGQDNKSVTLKRDGKDWVIASKDNYPVNETKLTAFLKKITSLRSRQLVTRTKASHERFKLGKNPNRKIVMTLADGTEKALLLGTEPNFKAVHVRLDDDDDIYLVRGLSSWEAPFTPLSWWRSEYVDLASADLVSVKLVNGIGEFSLLKNDKGKWHLVGSDAVLSDSAVRDFLESASRIMIAGYLGRAEKKEYGMDKPTADLTLKTGGKEIEVKVGAKQKESGDYVVKSSASPFYVHVGKYALDKLFTEKAELLIDKGQQDKGVGK